MKNQKYKKIFQSLQFNVQKFQKWRQTQAHKLRKNKKKKSSKKHQFIYVLLDIDVIWLVNKII